MKKQSIAKTIGAILLGILTLYGVQIVVGYSILPLLKANEDIGSIVYVILYNIFAYLFIWLIIKRFLKDSPSLYGLKRPSFSLKWLIFNLLFPFVIAIIITLLLPGHWGPIGNNLSFSEILCKGIIFTGFYGSVVEEVIFHGLVYPLLRQRFATFPASLITGVIFALVHMTNPGWTVSAALMFLVSSTCLSIYFAYITEESDSIWNAAWGHVTWNIIATSFVFNISPQYSGGTIFNYISDKDIFWITGGDSGLTLSPVTSIASLLLAFVISKMIKKRQASAETTLN